MGKPLIYPTLLQSANSMKSYSWYKNTKRLNSSYKNTPQKSIESTYIDTFIIYLTLTDKQIEIIDKWLDQCIDIYNLTNRHIKQCISDSTLNNSNVGAELDWYKIRSVLSKDIDIICKISKLNKHTAVEALHHCVSMYKSAFSNLGSFSEFNIKDLEYDRKRKNLAIEPQSISKLKNKNTMFKSVLGDNIISTHDLKLIKKTSILQYDEKYDTYKIIVPVTKKFKKKLIRAKKCGVDIGSRTFATVYSEMATYELGKDTYKTIDGYHKRIDNIKSSRDKGALTEIKYKYLINKYGEKLKNKIKDMHGKLACFLVNRFDTIVIGKVSISEMISNLRGNLRRESKRRIVTLAHYAFREKLKFMAKKYKVKIIETDEYLTTQSCCMCESRNYVGESKMYECYNCGLKIDRDINSGINIHSEKDFRKIEASKNK